MAKLVHMPLIYGEGRENAFIRLKDEINKASRGTLLALLLALFSKRENVFRNQEGIDLIAGKSEKNFTSSLDITPSGEITFLLLNRKGLQSNTNGPTETFPHLRPQY